MSEGNDLKIPAKSVQTLAEEVKEYKAQKQKFLDFVEEFRKKYKNERVFKTKLDEFLKGRTIEDWTAYFDAQIKERLSKIEGKTDEVVKQLKPEDKQLVMPRPSKEKPLEMPKPLEAYKAGPKTSAPTQTKQVMHETIAKEPKITAMYLNKKDRDRYVKELKIEEEYLERLRPKKEDEENIALKDYTVYEANSYGKFANKYVEQYSEKLIKSLPEMYEDLVHSLRTSDTKVLSKTYVSMMLFTSIIVSLALLIILPPVFILTSETSIFVIIKTLFQVIILSAVGGVGTMAGFYYYPKMQANNRQRQIKNDLPFVIIHMSAVAGSGANPIAMFNLIFGSGEYKGLEGEIKKIINYVNLFGYNLSTALRTVSLTTPSAEFKELLLGLVTTIESGGNMKNYLTAKADEAMTNYKLERKKYVEALSTYADVYTGILIAAPLLFFVTLAIIEMLGGAIMGMSVKMIASTGTYIALPLLNMGFILFLNLAQPE